MIGIVVALDAELPPCFKANHPHCWVRMTSLMAGAWHQYQSQPLLVVVTGVGACAADAVSFLLDNAPVEEIINIGMAGGPPDRVGQWVRLTHTTSPPHRIPCAPVTALPIPYESYPTIVGTTVKTPSPGPTHHAVDMEAYFMAKACQHTGVPFSSIKFITDTNSTAMITEMNAHFSAYMTHATSLFHALMVPSSRVSVVIPSFQRHNHLPRALESVARQTLSPSEVIVVDDGSTPPYPPSSAHHVIRHPTNQGVSPARNTGLRHATGDWIALLDSDDAWHPNHLESLMTWLKQHPWIRLAQTHETWIRNGAHLNKKAYHQKPQGWAFGASLHRCLVSPSAVILHRSLLDRFGEFNPALRVCEDYDLWLRILAYCPVGLVDALTVTKYGGHPDQLSTSTPAMDRFRLVALCHAYRHHYGRHWHVPIARIMKKKLRILIQGAKKRGHPMTTYASLLDCLNRHALIPESMYETLVYDVSNNATGSI